MEVALSGFLEETKLWEIFFSKLRIECIDKVKRLRVSIFLVIFAW